jgi:hypothetical protein
MPVTLDQQTLSLDVAPTTTLGQTMRWVQERLAEKGKVVIKVELDGQLLQGQLLTASDDLPIGRRALGFASASRKELATNMLAKMAALLEFIATQHQPIAHDLETGNTKAGMKRLGETIGYWNQVQAAFNQTLQLIGITLPQLHCGDLPATDALAQFTSQLTEIHGALQSKDTVLLADIMQYEMDGAVSLWTLLLEAAMGQAAKLA